MVWFGSRRPVTVQWRFLWAFGLLLLIPIQHAVSTNPQSDYQKAKQLFLRGYLENSQHDSEQGYRKFASNPLWASKFLLLEAEAMVWRGMYENALHVLHIKPVAVGSPAEEVKRLTLEGVAFAHLHQFGAADQKLMQADAFCLGASYSACGEVLRARGVLALELGELSAAQQSFRDSLSFARAHQDRWLETTALLNLGTASIHQEHFDESVDWSRSAYRSAVELGGEDLALGASGNLGWAFFELGDGERALTLFLEAQRRAASLGNIRDEVKWLTAAGNVYQGTGDMVRASRSYRQSLDLAKQIDSKEDIINSLEDLTHVSIDSKNVSEANLYIGQVAPLIPADGNRVDALDVELAQGRIAALQRHDVQAENVFRSVETNLAGPTYMRLIAKHELARLYESQGNNSGADRMYKASLTTFESARAELKNEESQLPFSANGAHIYDDYIHFLVSQGRTDEALAVADGSRARTLAQGLGMATNIQSFKPAALHPGAIAQKARATLLFYWLGEKQSYVWAITSNKTELFPLPAQSEITALIERYSKAVSQLDDTLNSANEDGLALYQTLIAPVSHLIRPGSTVVLLNDGPLSRLNFETLVVPGAKPHYWIEDATLISAPSIYMLASAQHPAHTGRKLLLLGDAISPDPDYSELPKAAFEMRQIERHFARADQTVFARKQATSAAYITSELKQFSYIHFVAHGVASRTDPLDSAIILSRLSNDADSFKLYAREIIQHPIRAQLVTISACSGSGSRSYVGEGMVGLSWAFLRAGAHNVIGALWEVSDDSTPRLMDALYQSLDDGMSPSAALRQAKLTLLHSEGGFRRPFFWASFQIYAGL